MVVRERLRMKKLISIILLGGALALSGCGSSENFVVTNTNNAVAPICVDDAYQVNSNAVLTVNAANGVLANDSPAGGTAVLQTASAQGGTVAGNADGSFVYTPATNFTGNDTFTYTVTNSFAAVTCTVTITVNAVNGFFVDSVNGNDTTGSFTNGQPFATIQAAAAAAPAGSDIVVRPGNYTGGINLEDGDRLLGSGSVLAVNPRALSREALETEAFNLVGHEAIDPANSYFVDSRWGNDVSAEVGPDSPFATVQAAVSAAPEGADIVILQGYYQGQVQLKTRQRLLGDGSPTTRFQLGATRPVLTGPIVLGDGNTVDYLRVENSPGDSINGDNRVSGAVTNCQLVNSGDDGLSIDPGTGTWDVLNNFVDGSGALGIGIPVTTSGAGQLTCRVNGNTVQNCSLDAIGFLSQNTSQLTAQVHGNIMAGNQAGATFEAFAGDMATMCLDMENNTNDDVYVFLRELLATTLEVEEFAVPTFGGNTGTAMEDTLSEPVIPVLDGACGF
jgi:Bacterial Ig domain